MNQIGEVVVTNGTDIQGLKSLFINAYVHNIKELNFYKKVPKEKRIILVTKLANEISKKCMFAIYRDKEDKKVIYSVVAYMIQNKELVIFFAYTKYPFRGFGFCKQIIEDLKRDTLRHTHVLPKKLGGFKLWENFNQGKVIYPSVPTN